MLHCVASLCLSCRLGQQITSVHAATLLILMSAITHHTASATTDVTCYLCMWLQVIERLDTVRVNKQGIPIEVALTQDMHHLGVARCLAWGIGQPDPELAKLSPAAATPTCWMVQEYCDKHTLVVSPQHLYCTVDACTFDALQYADSGIGISLGTALTSVCSRWHCLPSFHHAGLGICCCDVMHSLGAYTTSDSAGTALL